MAKTKYIIYDNACTLSRSAVCYWFDLVFIQFVALLIQF